MTRHDPAGAGPSEQVGACGEDTDDSRQNGGPASRSVYGPSPVRRKRRTAAELAAVDDAIVAAVEAEYPVTLRGVYYRVVSAGAVDKTEAAYKLVGRQLVKLRRDGRVAYNRITDGTRWVVRPTTWQSLDDMLDSVASTYRRGMWNDTPDEVMIFTEKDAIVGTIQPVTTRWDVPVGVMRGYCSETFAHEMAQSIRWSVARRSGRVFVYQLGDHDPSGLGAWDNFCRKVTGFLDDHVVQSVVFERLAVTTDQVEELGLPTRPTKRSDSRSSDFEGDSVEVDAIPAGTLREIVEAAITRHVDPQHLRVLRAAEESERSILYRLAGEVAS